MKAFGYQQAHNLNDFCIEEIDLPTPDLQEFDVLVKMQAIALNPVDYKIRQSKSTDTDTPLILGWDASGIVEKLGSQVTDFNVGDGVFYAGDLTRSGSYAELQAIDSRLIAIKPKSLSPIEAAALPLTSITAWEGLFERGIEFSASTNVLIIGGAGGVGTMATQLIKAKTDATVIATASRPDTSEWCKKFGADHIINHHQDLAKQLKGVDIASVDVVFCTTNSEQHLANLADIITPFGHAIFIQDTGSLDVTGFKLKSIITHWEFMFTKSMFGHNMQSQGNLLAEVAQLADANKIKTTLNVNLGKISADTLKQGHSLLESGKSIGKIALEF